MANAPLPPVILQEDADDLLDFYEFTGRTIPRAKWAIESIRAAQRQQHQSMF